MAALLPVSDGPAARSAERTDCLLLHVCPASQPVAVAGATREEYALTLPALRWGPPTLLYRRTGRCPSWCGSAICTLELEMRKVDQDAFFGSPSSRRLARACVERLRAIESYE